jgi:hypothetical protein
VRLLVFLAVNPGLADGLGAAHTAVEADQLAPAAPPPSVAAAVAPAVGIAAGVPAVLTAAAAAGVPAALAGAAERLVVWRLVPASFLTELLSAPASAAAAVAPEGVLLGLALLRVTGLLKLCGVAALPLLYLLGRLLLVGVLLAARRTALPPVTAAAAAGRLLEAPVGAAAGLSLSWHAGMPSSSSPPGLDAYHAASAAAAAAFSARMISVCCCCSGVGCADAPLTAGLLSASSTRPKAGESPAAATSAAAAQSAGLLL